MMNMRAEPALPVESSLVPSAAQIAEEVSRLQAFFESLPRMPSLWLLLSSPAEFISALVVPQTTQLSYAAVHLLFTVPVALLLLILPGLQLCNVRRAALLFICVVAVAWTTLWDAYLIHRGIWRYPGGGGSVAATLLGVPLEEYFFFIIQSIIVSLVTFRARDAFTRRAGPRDCKKAPRSSNKQGGSPGSSESSWCSVLFLNAVPSICLLFLTAISTCAYLVGGRWTYCGLILLWACPVLALQIGYGGSLLYRERCILPMLLSISVSTVSLWALDQVALEAKTW
jgi:lycopene cyclase domain-containing protein